MDSCPKGHFPSPRTPKGFTDLEEEAEHRKVGGGPEIPGQLEKDKKAFTESGWFPGGESGSHAGAALSTESHGTPTALDEFVIEEGSKAKEKGFNLG